MMYFRLRLLAALLVTLVLGGCQAMPETVKPVQGFELSRYLGTWYEIARLDHVFERGLSGVNAQYSMRDDGMVRVLNRGYSDEEGQWDDIEGKAKWGDGPDTAYLKVSFFGPFYGSYVVFELDDDYRYAFVSGNTTGYLWLLAREPEVDEAVRQRFVQRAAELGFDTDDLIWVDQSLNMK